MEIEYKAEDGVGIVTINRPERKNALTLEMRDEMNAHFLRLSFDKSIRAVLLTSTGDAFCSGADVGKMEQGDVMAGRMRLERSHRLIRALYHMDKPVIAAVRGPAVGIGWSLALACDLIVAGESARFAQVFKKVGLAPDGASAYFLAQRVGLPRAKELAFTARFVKAAEALTLGLVNRVVPDAEIDGAALSLAKEIADGPTTANAFTKRMFNFAVAPSLDQFLELELLAQVQLFQTDDHHEGVAAFKEKRPAKFARS